MRTVIYVGLIAIATAINSDWLVGEPVKVYSTIFIYSVIMDIVDFFGNTGNKISKLWRN